MNIKVQLILHTKYQPNIPSRSGKNGDFLSFAIFSNWYSRPDIILLLCSLSLIMLHMTFEIRGCSGLRDSVI